MKLCSIAIATTVLAIWCPKSHADSSDIVQIKSRNGTSPGTILDGEPAPDFRQWIEFTKIFHQSWRASKSDDVQQALRIPVDYLSIKDFRCKWGRPAFAATDTIYLCPANVVWYSEVSTFGTVGLFAQARWGEGEEYSQYAGAHLFEVMFPLWRNEVVIGKFNTSFPNSWMLLYCFRNKISSADCNPRVHSKSFDVWWQGLYNESERAPNTHIVRYWDLAREQFWLTIHFIYAHEAGHIALKHPSAASQPDGAQELEADRFAVRFLTAVGRSPLESLFTLQLLRYASAFAQRSSRSPVKDRLGALASQMRTDVADLLNDEEFWNQVSRSMGPDAASAFKQAMRAPEAILQLPWEVRR